MPDQRALRHDGNPDAVSRTAPSDLYSNSTVALDPETGKLAWYYQHLPGDDWDSDYTHERTLVRTRLNPDPKFVKWINPDIPRGRGARSWRSRSAKPAASSCWTAPRASFCGPTPFPFDAPEIVISDIDVKTGKTTINWDNVFKTPGETHTICYWNTRSYWPTAYSPRRIRCTRPTSITAAQLTTASPGGRESWKVVPRPGSDPKALTGLAKINLSTGEILRFDHRPRARQRSDAGDGRRPGLPRRHEPPLPGLRRRDRQAAVGDRFWAATFRSAPSPTR